MPRGKRYAKYNESWATQAGALLEQINVAVALAERYSPSALHWLTVMQAWVRDVSEKTAPNWWSNEDCEALIPSAEARVKQFVQTMHTYHREPSTTGRSVWAA